MHCWKFWSVWANPFNSIVVRILSHIKFHVVYVQDPGDWSAACFFMFWKYVKWLVLGTTRPSKCFVLFFVFIQILSPALLRTMGHSTIICIWWGGPPPPPPLVHTDPGYRTTFLRDVTPHHSPPLPPPPPPPLPPFPPPPLQLLSSISWVPHPFPPPLPPTPPSQLFRPSFSYS